MSAVRAIEFVCDVTGEKLVMREGDPTYISDHGYQQYLHLGSSYALRDAWAEAYRRGWRSHSLRDASSHFRTFDCVSPNGRIRSFGEYVTAPGVTPDPPYTKTALMEIERRDRYEAERAGLVDSELARLRGEIARLEAVAAERAEAVQR